jgi:ferredoxin
MAKVKIIDENKTVEVPDGSLLVTLEDKSNILFSCKEGVCTTCLVHVVSGMENLEPPNEIEEMTLSTLPLEHRGKSRLLCVTKIKTGEIQIKLP